MSIKALLLALWLTVLPAAGPNPPIAGFWRDTTLYLQITQPGCLSMFDAGPAIALPASCGVMSYQLYQDDPNTDLRPWGRTIVLVGFDGKELSRWSVPSRPAVFMPLVLVAPAPRRLQSPLAPSWQGATLIIPVSGPGCLMAMPGDTGTGWCDFSGQAWEAQIGRYGDYATAAGVTGRWYERERGGQRVERFDVPRLLVWLPDVAKE